MVFMFHYMHRKSKTNQATLITFIVKKEGMKPPSLVMLGQSLQSQSADPEALAEALPSVAVAVADD